LNPLLFSQRFRDFSNTPGDQILNGYLLIRFKENSKRFKKEIQIENSRNFRDKKRISEESEDITLRIRGYNFKNPRI